MKNLNNSKVSRSLSAILAGSDEATSDLNEMVAEKECKACDEAEKKEEPVEESEEVEVTDDSEDQEEITDEEDEEPVEIEEITDEEVESARKEDEEPEEIEEDVEIDDEEPIEVTDEEVDETMDEEPVEIEEITDEEVGAARKEMEDDDEDVVEVDENDEPISEEEPELDEEQNDDETIEEEVDDEAIEGEDGEESEIPDEEATTEAVATLAQNNFVCHIDNKGRITVTACGDKCECGQPGCPECNPEEKSKEEEASVTLRPVDGEEKVQAEDVCAVLSDAEGSNPFYTILLKGMPVAAIYLEDQPNKEEIRSYFLSNNYAKAIASAMSTSSVKDVLDTQHAKMFVAKATKSELAGAMKAEAKAEFDEQIAQAVIAAKDKFVNAVKLAVAGMNKNFFTEDNNLKAAAYAEFSKMGLDENVAQAKTEAIFAQADNFFDVVIAKAQELMGKSDEAFAEVSEMVAQAGTAARATKTFASALEQGNNKVIAGAMMPNQVEVQVEHNNSTVEMIRSKKIFGRR